MVFDAAKPIKKNKSFSSIESVLDEERKEVLKFLETHEMQLSKGLKNKLRSFMPYNGLSFRCLENNLEVGLKSNVSSNDTLNSLSLSERLSSKSLFFDSSENNKSVSNDIEFNPYKTCFSFSNCSTSQSNDIFTEFPNVQSESRNLNSDFSKNYDHIDLGTSYRDSESLDGYIKLASSYLGPTVNKLESLSLSDASEINEKSLVKSPEDSYTSVFSSQILETVNKTEISENNLSLQGSGIPLHSNMRFSTECSIDSDECRKVQNMKIDMGTIIFTEDRTIRTIKRGEYSPSYSESRRVRSYLVPIDLSSESLYALEWAIGTIVRDYDTMMIVEAIDKDDKDDKGIVELEKERLVAMEEICQITQKLLKKTRLILQIEIEIIHHKAPKHLLTEMIDYLEPTLVILGSRGRSSLKGVILGSFSNYIVNKSSVPVMVTRKKPRKSKSKRSIFGTNIRMVNNLLTKAIID
ncbi:hypothetical protein PORY_001722 [Pneumocystis oryctolagi]|uniref:Uncharacterized protein n=1 Tax=Pneumocystis oryctolagi TaxID=42067 RepID=A0ACB7CDA2_9ASCO|nr:hypothetical protein PORY_001722 [Pneumocystis oryctolagi]